MMTHESYKNMRIRIHEFDRVVRDICTELGLCYGGVDTPEHSAPILEAIRKLKQERMQFLGRGKQPVMADEFGD